MAIDFNKIPGYIRREIDPPKKSVVQGAKNTTVKRIQKWLNYHQCRTGIDGGAWCAGFVSLRDEAFNKIPIPLLFLLVVFAATLVT